MNTIIAITGASGSLFGVEFLKQCPGEKYLVLSRWGKSVLMQETGMTYESLLPQVKSIYANEDMNAPFASGSTPFDAMVIVPCSASTLSKIAVGIADSLITRMAQVALKEKRTLVLCLRETPLSAILLKNMLTLARSGAVVMPISPGYYPVERGGENPASIRIETVQQTAELFAQRILSLLSGVAPELGWNRSRI